MAAIDQLIAGAQDSIDLGAALTRGLQGGAILGQSFRAQDAALNAVAAENRAANAAAFEMSIRAGKSLAEKAERELRQKRLAQEASIAQENLAIARGNLEARNREVDIKAKEAERKSEFLDKIMGGRGSSPSPSGGFSGGGGFTGPLPRNEATGDNTGPIDTSLFGDPSGTGEQAITQDTIPGLKTTWYNRTEPGADPDTKKNLGAWGNQLSPNAIALSQDVVDALGAQRGALLEYTTEDGSVGYGPLEDLAGTQTPGVTGRVDLNVSEKARVGVDQPVTNLRIVAPGDDTLAGEELRALAESNWGRLQTPDPANEDARSLEDTTREEDGTQPNDYYFDPSYIRELPPNQRVEYYRTAKARRDFANQRVRDIEDQLIQSEGLMDRLNKSIEFQEEAVKREAEQFDAIGRAGAGITGIGPLVSPDDRPQLSELQRLQEARDRVSSVRSSLNKEKIERTFEAERAAENMSMTSPEFGNMSQDQGKKLSNLRLVKTELPQIRELFRATKDKEGKDVVSKLISTIPGQKIAGLLQKGKAAVWEDKDYEALQSAINQLVPTIARGIFGEVGVLTDADREIYKGLFPGASNSEELGEIFLTQMEQKMDTMAKEFLDSAMIGQLDAPLMRQILQADGFKNLGTAGLTPGGRRAKEVEADQAKENESKPEVVRPDTGKRRRHKGTGQWYLYNADDDKWYLDPNQDG